MATSWWKRVLFVVEAATILAFVPFALYPSPITALVLLTLPAAVALLGAAASPAWFVRRPRLRRYAHISAVASATTAVIVAAWIAFVPSRPTSIHLVPSNYRGPVTVVFECPSAPPPTYEGRALVYDVPENGVLLVRDKFDGREPRIRQVTTGGAARELSWVDSRPTKVAAFRSRAPSRMKGGGLSRLYRQYIIGDYVQWDQPSPFERALDNADIIGARLCAPPSLK